MTLRAHGALNALLSVATDAALSAIPTNYLVSGDTLWSDQSGLYVFNATSTDPLSSTVLATGSSNGGALPGRFIFTGVGPSGPPVADTLVFSNRTALAAFDTTSLADGQNARTTNIIAGWRLDKTSVLTVDGIDVVSANPTGRWIRSSVAILEYVKQTAYFVDPVAGSNEFDGLTALTAIKQHREWYARTRTLFTTTTNYQIIGDGTGLDAWSWGLTPDGTGNNGLWIFIGSLVQFSTGTMTAAATSETPAANTGPTVTDALRVWGPSVGKVIYTTSGPAAAAIVLADLGGGVARVSPWFTPLSFGGSAAAPANGTTYQIVDYTSFSFAEQCMHGPGYIICERVKPTNVYFTQRNWRAIWTEVQFVNGTANAGSACTGSQFLSCAFTTTSWALDAGGSSFFFRCGFTVGLMFAGGTKITVGDTVFQGAGIASSTFNVPTGGFCGTFGNLGIFSASVALDIQGNANLRIQGVNTTWYGSGNTIGLRVASGATAIVRTAYTPTLAATTQISITGGSTGLLPPNAVRSGTSTLGGGTKTVAVSTTAKTRIAVSRNTPAGVLGAGGLDAPQASRLAGSFVVNAIDLAGALVATETSTFDYHLIEDPTILTTWAVWFAAPFSGNVTSSVDGSRIITGS